jgi:hydrogenase maturation factor
MHDPTEGGVAGGIHEMADASNVGFKVYRDRIPIAKETLRICRFLEIDPLQLIASGSLLIAVERGYASEVLRILERNRIAARVIGELTSSPSERLLIREGNIIEDLARPLSDELWQALKK